MSAGCCWKPDLAFRRKTRAGSGRELSGAIAADKGAGAPPPWFIALVRPEQATQSVPIVVEGKSLGSLVIASHPTDEIAEIWDGIVTQVEIGSALAVALFLVTIVVVSRALAPIQSLADAMASIEAGRYDTRVVPTGSAEIADICGKLNHLANALGNAVEEKQHLAERVVSLQDVERKEIARELHDEFGPYLFALRAHATSLACAGMATRCWTRSTPCSSSTVVCSKSCGLPGLVSLD